MPKNNTMDSSKIPEMLKPPRLIASLNNSFHFMDAKENNPKMARIATINLNMLLA